MVGYVYTWFSTGSWRFWYQDCTLYDIKIADYGLSKYNEEDKAPRFLRVSLHEVNSKTLKRKTWIQHGGHYIGPIWTDQTIEMYGNFDLRDFPL